VILVILVGNMLTLTEGGPAIDLRLLVLPLFYDFTTVLFRLLNLFSGLFSDAF
jgi:hypothetical protein